MGGTLAWFRANWGRAIGALALITVVIVSGVVSYTHIESLTLALHQPLVVARLYPLGVDGLIVVGSIALLQPPKDKPWLGWLGVAPGVAASVFANVESGIRYGVKAAIWSGMPAASFALATYLFERWLKSQVGRGGSSGQPNTEHADTDTTVIGAFPCSHQVALSLDESVVQAFLHARDCIDAPLSQRQLAAAFDLPRTRVRQLVGQVNGYHLEDPPDDIPELRDVTA